MNDKTENIRYLHVLLNMVSQNYEIKLILFSSALVGCLGLLDDKFNSINILNIGGIANITKSARWDNFYKSTDMLQASDIGPGNCMIDSWIRNNSNSMFDD